MSSAMETTKSPVTDLTATLRERGSRHGEFRDHAAYTQTIKRVMQSSPNWVGKMEDMHRESLEMIAHKIGRILAGDPNYADNWHDIAGYAKLVDDRLQEDVAFPFGANAEVPLTDYKVTSKPLYCDYCEHTADFANDDFNDYICAKCAEDLKRNLITYATLEK